MEGTEKVDERYKTGFEYGYWMTKAKSIEYDGLLKRTGNHEHFSKGLVAGKIEADRERVRNNIEFVDGDKSEEKDSESNKEQEDVQRFMTGYEHGYWLKRANRKELDDIISRKQINSHYKAGVTYGAREAEREKFRDQKESQKRRSHDVDRGVDLG